MVEPKHGLFEMFETPGNLSNSVMATQCDLHVLLRTHLYKLGVTELTLHQCNALTFLQKEVDCFIVLPTGSGKSLIYQLAAWLSSDSQSKVVVVMPLKALMDQQQTKMISAGYSCSTVSDYPSAVKSLADDLQYILLSPEALCSSFMAAAQANRTSSSRIRYVFVDESHCVSKWGLGDKRSHAFRSKYNSIGELRSICPQATFAAMTATATKATEAEVCNSLQMPTYQVIRQSPERPNIRYSVVMKKGSISECFQWLLEEFGCGEVMKTLIFFKHLSYIGEAYSFLHKRSPEGSIAMFHSRLSDSTKHSITQSFCQTGGIQQLRVVLCSSAFSMGLDIPDVRRVIHYGVPVDVDEYVQETGRAGRDGNPAAAVVLRHDNTLAGGHISVDMKQYLNTTECRRAKLLSFFGTDISDNITGYRCCDNCSAKISCCSCGAIANCQHVIDVCYCVKWCGMLTGIERQTQLTTVHRQTIRPALGQQEEAAVRERLSALVVLKKTVPDNVNPVNYDLITRKISDFQFIRNSADVLSLGAFSKADADIIMTIVNEFELSVCDLSIADVSADSDSDSSQKADVSADSDID